VKRVSKSANVSVIGRMRAMKLRYTAILTSELEETPTGAPIGRIVEIDLGMLKEE
jgi:hypothetical protein